MPPEFTVEEQYVLASIKSRPWTDAVWFDLSYLAPLSAAILYGQAIGSIVLVACALLVVIAFRAWDWSTSRRYLPVWRRLIEKYERAAAESPSEG